jgi:hypothetical protein
MEQQAVGWGVDPAWMALGILDLQTDMGLLSLELAKSLRLELEMYSIESLKPGLGLTHTMSLRLQLETM